MTSSRREYKLAPMRTDDVTLQRAGLAALILIISGGLGLLISLLLLRLYRRALQRGMVRNAGKPVTPQNLKAAPTDLLPPPPPLALTWINTGRAEFTAADSRALYLRARTGLWRAGAVYACAGNLFAAILAAGFLQCFALELRPLPFLLQLWIFLWPLVLTLSVIAVTTRRRRLILTTGYVTGYGILVL